tara:strand:- start:29 stop:334 length:306 start_codon:yes stop_codon:yes gene_type:complete
MNKYDIKQAALAKMRQEYPDLGEEGIRYIYFICNREEIEAENRKKDEKYDKTFTKNLWSRTPKKINGSYPKLTGIDRKFKEAELDADYNAMSDHYEDNPQW